MSGVLSTGMWAVVAGCARGVEGWHRGGGEGVESGAGCEGGAGGDGRGADGGGGAGAVRGVAMNGEVVYEAWRTHVNPSAPVWASLSARDREGWERVDEACAITHDLSAVTEIGTKLDAIRESAEEAMHELLSIESTAP